MKTKPALDKRTCLSLPPGRGGCSPRLYVGLCSTHSSTGLYEDGLYPSTTTDHMIYPSTTSGGYSSFHSSAAPAPPSPPPARPRKTFTLYKMVWLMRGHAGEGFLQGCSMLTINLLMGFRSGMAFMPCPCHGNLMGHSSGMTSPHDQANPWHESCRVTGHLLMPCP